MGFSWWCGGFAARRVRRGAARGVVLSDLEWFRHGFEWFGVASAWFWFVWSGSDVALSVWSGFVWVLGGFVGVLWVLVGPILSTNLECPHGNFVIDLNK